MRTYAKASIYGCCLLLVLAALFLVASPVRALHRESPPVVRITSAADHEAPTGVSFGNWWAFASTQDLANEGALRAPGTQIFVWNQGFFDCAQGTTKDTCGTDTTSTCQRTPCPPPGTPFLRQVTNTTTGDPANPSMDTAPFGSDVNDVWVAFDALGSFICLPTDTACLAQPSASRRQIFMLNLLTNEIRQITFGVDGDSVRPSVNRAAGVVTFESTATGIDGFPNPAGVSNVFVCKVNVTGNPAQPATQCRQLSIGPVPARIIPVGPSTLPFVNENGTAVAWESTADILGSGLNTGVKQIYFATFDKTDFFRHASEAQIFRVTNGNGPSQHPFLGFTAVPNPAPGASGQSKILLFSSTATNLPNSNQTAGSQIYQVQTDLLTQLPGQPPPVVPVQHVTTSAQFGNCDWPTVDPAGLRYGFTCDGDPLQNGTTGNRAFGLSTGSRDNNLFQLTGTGDTAGRVVNNIGQWFMQIATTSDLTGAGVCGHQLYVIDYTAGKWLAAFQLHQLPPDVTPTTPNSRIGLRNFSILPAGSAAGVSTTIVTSLAGATTSNVPRTKNPIDQGLIGMQIGGPDLFTLEADITVDHTIQQRIKLPPVLVPGFGAICMTPTGDGTGSVDCDGGEASSNPTLTQDHYTDNSNFDCSQGCREDQACFPPTYPFPRSSYAGPYKSLCPVCVFTPIPNAPPPTSGLCSAGPFTGLVCTTDVDCRPGVTCDANDNLVPMCKGPISTTTVGTFVAGDVTLNIPINVTLSQAAGPDGEFCSGDDQYANLSPLPFELHFTTQTATATILDADPLPSATGGPTLGQTVTATLTGAPFDCGRLRAGDLGGARLVAELPILNLPNVPGLHDVVVGLNFVPDPNPLSSCDPFCLGSATCNDGNACNGTETCNTTTSRCQVGTPPCPAPDACHTITCDATTGACGTPTQISCDDGNPCTDDTCDPTNGCVHTANNNNTCTLSDMCLMNPVCTNGTCTGTPTAVAAGCTNTNICANGTRACNPNNGLCETVNPDPCNDTNSCTTDSCANNTCSHTSVQDGTACNDSNMCTGTGPGGAGDTCTGGICSGPAKNCADNTVCNGMETCNPATGCVAGTPLTCPDTVCTIGSCDPVSGCLSTPKPNGTGCDDGSACTNPDTCTNGVCTGPLLTCPGDACNPPACLPGSGCTNLGPPNCDDNNPCTDDSVCDPATGCVHTPILSGCCQAGGVVCPTANQCNATSSCSTPGTPTTGTCVAGPGLTCADTNPCTDDSCDPASGCVHTPTTGGACDTGTACITGGVCNNGTCTGTPMSCNDNDVCNGTETCDPVNGCVKGTPPNCDDGDACTTDTCDMVLGCQNGSDPASYALCRLNLLADAIQGTPAEELGGLKKKKKFMQEVTGSLKALQKALAASPRQKKQNLRKAELRLSRLNNGLQKMVNTHQIQDALGNQLLDLVSKAGLALEALS
jgi:Dictyostelium (slime mold) repeat